MVKYNQFMGYRINALSLTQLVDICVHNIHLSIKKNLIFSCANPHSLAIAEKRSDFKQALQNTDFLVTDGVGLSVVGRIMGINLSPRIAGGDFFTALMERQNKATSDRKTRVYFFGSSTQVLKLMKAKLETSYPNLEICGYTSPPYGEWSEEEETTFINNINSANPDILWVGMTAPKQEIWTDKNKHRLDVSVIGNIGAVFDFCAGTYERAPMWAQKAGLEWLVRLCKEPKRMWRRNLISPAVFVIAAIKATLPKKLNDVMGK